MTGRQTGFAKKSARREDTSPAIRSFRIDSEATGTVPTFVLLHGVGLSHRFFSPLARILCRTGHVVSFDLPGFGSTPHPTHAMSVEEYAALIDAELERLGTGPAVVVGHSMGAQFAIELAVRNRAAASHVVVSGPVVDPARRSLRAQSVGLLRDAPLEPLHTQATVLFDYIRCGIPWFVTEAAAMRDYPTHSRVAGIEHPLLVIRGEHDPVAKQPWSRWLSEQVPTGELVVIAGKRHNVPHSAPAATAAAITGFVGQENDGAPVD